MLTRAEVFSRADAIVQGEIIETDGKYFVEVKHTFKGPNDRRLWIDSGSIEGKWAVLKKGQKGIFLLRGSAFGFYQSGHPQEILPENAKEKVERTLEKLKNFGPSFLDTKKHPHNSETAWILGHLFRAGRITCMENRFLSNATMFTYGLREIDHGGLWPWDQEGIATIVCRADPKDKEKIEIKERYVSTSLGKALIQRVQAAWNSTSNRHSFRAQKTFTTTGLTVTLDNRKPKKASGITRDAARNYLQECLKSNDARVLREALTAINKMQDIPSMPAVAPLLKDKRAWVVIQAAGLLSRSRQPQYVKTMFDTLARYEKTPTLGGASNQHVQNCLIIYIGYSRTPRSIEFLKQMAQNGADNAIHLLIWTGTTETMQAVMKLAKANPKKWAYADKLFAGWVRRSNTPLEKWMQDASTVWTTKTADKRLPKWFAWWEKNKSDFKIP